MYIHKDLARSTLAAGIAAGATSFTVATGEGAKFPEGPQFVTIYDATTHARPDLDPDKEVIRVSSRSGDTFTVAERGYNGTDDDNHNTAGKTYAVFHSLIAAEFDSCMRRPSWRRWRFAQATGGASSGITALGINHIATGTTSSISPSSTEPALTNYASAGTTNSTAGFGTNGNPVCYWGRNNYAAFLVKFQESASMRAFVGLTDRAFGTLMGSDTPTGTVAFRYSTNASDTNWKIYLANGSIVVDTGVAFSTNLTLFEIFEDNNTGTLYFYINGVLVHSRTTNLPPAGHNFPSAGVATLQAVAKNIRVGYIYVEDDQ
jgi:hypothetical protein